MTEEPSTDPVKQMKALAHDCADSSITSRRKWMTLVLACFGTGGLFILGAPLLWLLGMWPVALVIAAGGVVLLFQGKENISQMKYWQGVYMKQRQTILDDLQRW